MTDKYRFSIGEKVWWDDPDDGSRSGEYLVVNQWLAGPVRCYSLTTCGAIIHTDAFESELSRISRPKNKLKIESETVYARLDAIGNRFPSTETVEDDDGKPDLLLEVKLAVRACHAQKLVAFIGKWLELEVSNAEVVEE